MFVGFVGGGGLIEILTANYTTRFLCQKYPCEPINSKLLHVGKIIHCAKCLDFAAYEAGGSVNTVPLKLNRVFFLDYVSMDSETCYSNFKI